ANNTNRCPLPEVVRTESRMPSGLGKNRRANKSPIMFNTVLWTNDANLIKNHKNSLSIRLHANYERMNFRNYEANRLQTQYVLAMKLTLLLMLVGMFQVSAFTYAQR